MKLTDFLRVLIKMKHLEKDLKEVFFQQPKSSRRRLDAFGGSQSTQQIMTLSLMLLLLAFFVALTSMTTIKKVQSDAIISSVSRQFSLKNDSLAVSTKQLVARDVALSQTQNALIELQKLFETDFPVAQTRYVSNGDLLIVSFAGNDFFQGTVPSYMGQEALSHMIDFLQKRSQSGTSLTVTLSGDLSSSEGIDLTIQQGAKVMGQLEANLRKNISLLFEIKNKKTSEIHFLFNRSVDNKK